MRRSSHAPVLPAAVKKQAQAIAGLSDTTLTTDRLENILQACAEHVETRAGRMFWPGNGGAVRKAVTIIEVHHCGEPLSACPLYQDTAGSDVTIDSVERHGAKTARARSWEILDAETSTTACALSAAYLCIVAATTASRRVSCWR